jgi:hypothetical protein
MSRLLAVLIAALFLAPASAHAAIGPTSPGSSIDYNVPGRAQTYRNSSTATGQVNRLSVYLDATTTAWKVEVGLYANGGARLGRCTITAPVAGWNRCAMTTVTVTKGTNYWTAVLQPAGTTGTIRYRNTNGTGQTYGSSSSSLSALPSAWTNGPYWGPQTASIYADQATAAAPAPTADFTVSPDNATTGSSTTFDASPSTCAASPCSYT